jgi:hypothetical protein
MARDPDNPLRHMPGKANMEPSMTNIRPDTRLGDLLKERPELLDVLTGYTPAFAKLRNPLVRRTFGRMTTLAQAASMGGVDLGELLRTLRAAAGEPEPMLAEPSGAAWIPISAATPEPPPWWNEACLVAQLDARPFHERGEDPLAAIMKATTDVPEGAIFYLRNTFEPLPLYDVLGKKGFHPWARHNGPDDWEVFFYRSGPGEEVRPAAAPAAESGAPPVASVQIDVSQLTPPEPMVRVLEALASSRPGETLLVRHPGRSTSTPNWTGWAIGTNLGPGAGPCRI